MIIRTNGDPPKGLTPFSTGDDIPTGSAVFVDANIFVYYFEPHPVLGPACQQLFLRIENSWLKQHPAELQRLARHRLAVDDVARIAAGVLLGVVFGAANAYLDLRVGMTVSSSIPAAVMTVAIFKLIRARGTVLEANLSQTVGTASKGPFRVNQVRIKKL